MVVVRGVQHFVTVVEDLREYLTGPEMICIGQLAGRGGHQVLLSGGDSGKKQEGQVISVGACSEPAASASIRIHILMRSFFLFVLHTRSREGLGGGPGTERELIAGIVVVFTMHQPHLSTHWALPRYKKITNSKPYGRAEQQVFLSLRLAHPQ